MALWTPEYIDTALWLDAADSSTITESSGAVSQWADKSGNGLDAVQTNGTAQPLFSEVALGGSSAVCFDGVNDFLSGTQPFGGTTPRSIFAVYQMGTLRHQGSSYFQLTNDGAEEYGKWWSQTTEPDGWWIRVFRNTQHGGAPATNRPYLSAVTWSSGNLSTSGLWIDGSSVARSSGVDASINTYDGYSYTLGQDIVWGGLNYSDYDLSELIVLDSAVDTDTRQKIEGYLAHKWGLTANLPSDHPYKSAAPTVRGLSGIIRDRFGNPCKRKVYAVSRPTDSTAPQILAHGLSDPTTGAYELAIPTSEEVTRVVVSEDNGNNPLDPDEPLLNDIVDRVIPE